MKHNISIHYQVHINIHSYFYYLYFNFCSYFSFYYIWETEHHITYKNSSKLVWSWLKERDSRWGSKLRERAGHSLLSEISLFLLCIYNCSFTKQRYVWSDAANNQRNVHENSRICGENSHSTYIDALQVTVGHSRCNNSIIGIDNGNNVHPQQFMKGAVQVTSLLLIMKIQIGDQNLQKEIKN